MVVQEEDGEGGEDGGWLRLAEALSMGHGWARLTTLDLSGEARGVVVSHTVTAVRQWHVVLLGRVEGASQPFASMC